MYWNIYRIYRFLLQVFFFCVFHTPHFPHSSFSTLLIFTNPTLRIFHTPHTHFPPNLQLWYEINKLTSVFYASVLLLMINFVITLSKCCGKCKSQFVFYNNKTPKLMLKRRKEMEDEIATKPEFHRHNSEKHGLVN